MGPNYSRQKFLIIDDFPEFRVSLKSIVQQLGAIEIDTANNAEVALKKCSETRYDIILSDYNLGEGKDGQQVLEELIFRDHLKPTTVYVMITAENTMEMVMGALEHTPDSYLTKPFTKSLLNSRLDKLLTKKIALEKVNKAISMKDYNKAIKECNALISSGSKYIMACQRIKANLFDKMGDFGQSKIIYSKVIKDRPVPWALMGMGKLLYAQDDYQDAHSYFKQVVKSMPTFPEALDWLARVQQVLGDPEAAQRTLQSAVKVSSKAILRQMHLGNLAMANKDYVVARRAFKSSVKLGRTSCYKTPENYLKLAAILKESLTPEGGIKNKRIADEAFRVLDELEKDYIQDKEIKLRSTLSRHALFHKLVKAPKAEEMLSKAKKQYNELKVFLSGNSCADMAQACKDGQDYETCQEVLANILEKFGDDKELMASIESIIDDKEALKKAIQASKINNIGMKAASSNDSKAAIEAFKEAIAISPDNISYNMNLAQVLIRKSEASGEKGAILEEAFKCLSKLKVIKQHDHRFLRFQQLLRMANDLNIGAQ